MAVSGSAEQLWQWAQGERPLRLPVPDLPSPLDGHGAMDFIIRSRPYLAAPPPPGERGAPAGPLRELSAAVQNAMRSGASGVEIRRAVELTMTHPPLTEAEIKLRAQLEETGRDRL